jgi:hypothetical protein
MRRLVARFVRSSRFNPYGPQNRSARQERHKPIYRFGPRIARSSTVSASRTTSGGAGVQHRLNPFAKAAVAVLLVVIHGASLLAADKDGNPLRQSAAEPAAWQGPALTAQLAPVASPNAGVTAPTPPVLPPQPVPPQPNLRQPPNTTTPVQVHPGTPLLDGNMPAEELMPPVVSEGSAEGETEQHRGVRPYGGGHPNDWSWGCAGSPYRTGPGLCDNWKVGCRWHVTADGLVWHRESTDLVALAGQMPNSFPAGVESGIPTGVDPSFEQFDHGPGGRVTFTSQISRCTGYDIQAVYEGINDWNASIVYPIQALHVVPDADGATAGTQFVIPPSPNTEPPQPFPEGFLQRSLHYRSSINSGELNWVRNCDPEWRPYCGVRFIRFDDEINDSINQEAQPPLAGPQTGSILPGPNPPATPVLVNDPIGPTSVTDRFNLFHIQNNLMGFQIGLLHDTVHLNDRFAIEGFINGGVYYNRIKYSNVKGVFTTQVFADNTRTTTFDESRTDVSNAVINDARDLSEISYEAEASLTGVCRLNKCWALRAGYQMLWVNHLHMADTAFLGDAEASQDLLFHGWHAGIECRR